MSNEIKTAVLLAAGRGTRLGALTADRPKPMVPILGKPVLEHILLRLRGVGIQKFVFVVGYRAEAIQTYFETGARWDVAITYAFQPQPNGTGSALAAAKILASAGPVLTSFGDILTAPAHYQLLLDAFGRTRCEAVVGINPMEDISAGAAVYREGDRVVRVVEKPPKGTAQSHWNLAGASVYSANIWTALDNLKPSARGEYEITDAIAGLINTDLGVRACEFTGFWSDIGTPEALHAAEQALMEQRSVDYSSGDSQG